jgi:restriction system protein
MAEITGKRVGELQSGVFKILLDFPDGLPAKDVLNRLPQVALPTEFEKSDYPKHPGIRRFEKMARFATIGPVKAGWLVKSKGRWYMTEEGRKTYNQIMDPEKFNGEARRLYLQ